MVPEHRRLHSQSPARKVLQSQRLLDSILHELMKQTFPDLIHLLYTLCPLAIAECLTSSSTIRTTQSFPPLPGACGRRYVIYIPISYALVPFPPCPGSHRCHQLICEGFCRGGGLDNTFNIFLNVPCVRRTTRK